MKRNILLLIISVMLAGAARGQQATDTTVVYYRQGYSVVELTLRNNRAALEGFLNRFNASMQDSTLHLVSFRLDAYASPEGTAAANDRLSENRAKRLAEYICSRTGLSESDLTIEGHGIDWEQLEEKTAASDVPYKEEVLDVLRNTPEWIYDDNNRIIDGRKHRLGMLRGGVPYNYLSEHIFPLLRRSCITLSYTVEPLEQPAEERPAEERPAAEQPEQPQRRGCRTARSGTRFHSRTGGGQAGVPAAAGREDQPALLGDGHARLQKLYVRSEPRNRVFLQRALVAFRHRRLGEMGIRRRRLFRNIVLQPRTPLVVQGRRAFPLVLSGVPTDRSATTTRRTPAWPTTAIRAGCGVRVSRWAWRFPSPTGSVWRSVSGAATAAATCGPTRTKLPTISSTTKRRTTTGRDRHQASLYFSFGKGSK